MDAMIYVYCQVRSCLLAPPRCAPARRGEQGALLVEYVLLLALIVLVCILAVTYVGNNAANRLSKVGESVANA